MPLWMMLLACSLLLAGCAHGASPWIRDPRVETQAYYNDRYACLQEARQGWYVGHPFFVMAQQNRMYLPCMQQRGWFVPKPKGAVPAANSPPARHPVMVTTHAAYCRQLGQVAWEFGESRNQRVPLTTAPAVQGEIPGIRDTYRTLAVLVYSTPEETPEALQRLTETTCLQPGTPSPFRPR